MTFQPPPPPPGGNPPSSPPPPGQWGPLPGGGYPAPQQQRFDPKTVNSLDWGILAAGLLAFIVSFTSYYSYSVSTKIAGISESGSVHWSAWHGFFGCFGMLVALVGSGLVAMELFVPQFKLPFAARLIGLGCYALA